ncbi:uridine permease/thiamine transporter/allantoin transport [Aspergillus flavus]|uniref:Uridine permease/thiamine transporter/allantoin transport n=2 Tax=Aspergillus subgen. Circumdati TaxID=2720871 RepID=A0A7U2MPF5_ASPFN|nr:uridine permease/thiamine transporter/allantoin transport [Aspergillus oryzae 3.042]KDE78484.1 uridine permease/thiamine transporter/allantoin transport [Aspergillus oryzae 100-8]QRD87050.1 uridine permease/thiamine transporter/allantoin transport [Aspergillus flavus]|eukprot:EIT79646.1 uridine permease/thiamine transporter/allantoin transport [Aspergillus oryzae 3.042]
MSLLKRSINILQVPTEPGLTTAELMLTNEDLRPVEPERRQWRWLNFVAFWIADSLNVNTWMITSSMIVDGLSWWQAWLCVWIGYTISGIFVIAMGRIATIYHIPFAVANRASFGIWGSFWPILNRAAMAVIWYGVQMMTNSGLGQCVTLMIQAIWPSYVNIPNNIPASSGVTTMEFTSFFLFWLGSLPALWFPIYKIRHLFTAKAYFSPACAIAFFVWAIVRAHGLGPIIHQPNTAQGSTLAWAFVKSIMNCIANFAALIINNPDFSRYAAKPNDAVWPQLITIPVGFAVTSFIGIMVTSSSSVIFGQAVWNPLTLLGMFLEDASSAERFGVFVIAAGFALAQLGTNIAANSVSAGTNLSALLPRFCTIRRGAYVCAAIGLAMCPWNLVASSNKFTVYLSSYSVFLSSIAGVMISDYYLARRGYLELQALYSAERNGPYYGTWGVSWRGYTAYICGILINIVGFAGAVGAKVPVAAEYIYNINYLSGFLVAAAIYWALAKAFPIPCTSETWNEVPYLGEAMHADGKVIAEATEVEDVKAKV